MTWTIVIHQRREGVLHAYGEYLSAEPLEYAIEDAIDQMRDEGADTYDDMAEYQITAVQA